MTNDEKGDFTMKRMTALLLAVLLLATLLVGCSSSAKKDGDKDEEATTDSVAGTYVLKSVNGEDPTTFFKKMLEDEGYSVEAFAEQKGISPSDVAMSITVTLKGDGTFTATENAFGEETTSTGTWTLKGSTVTMITDDDPDEPDTLEYKDGKLTQTETNENSGETVTMVYKKG